MKYGFRPVETSSLGSTKNSCVHSPPGCACRDPVTARVRARPSHLTRLVMRGCCLATIACASLVHQGTERKPGAAESAECEEPRGKTTIPVPWYSADSAGSP